MDGALTGKTGFTGGAGYSYVGALKKDGKLFVTNNKNRTTILDFNLFVVSNAPHFIVNAIDPDINNDFFDYTFRKISEDDFLLKLIKIFKKEAKKALF